MNLYRNDKATLRSDTKQEGYKKCERKECSLWFKIPSRALMPKKVTRCFCSNECLILYRKESAKLYGMTRRKRVRYSNTQVTSSWNLYSSPAADIVRAWVLGIPRIVVPKL